MKPLLHRYRRIASETAWVFVAQGLSAIAALVGLRLITELVPPAIYGTVALVLGVVALAQALAAGPLMQAVLRFYPEFSSRERATQLRRAALLALRTPFSVAVISLAALAVGWSLYQPQAAWLMALSVALLAAEIARSVEITFLNAARRQRAMALLVAADAWLRPVAASALVWIWGSHGELVLLGYLAGCLIALTAFWLLARRTARSQALPPVVVAPIEDVCAHLRRYALPLTALPLIGWVSGQADRYMLASLSGVEAVGLYAALYSLASRPFLMFSGSVELALRQPYYARASAGDSAAERWALAQWLATIAGGSFMLWLLFGLFHAEIATLLLAARYRSHSVLMAWIGAGYVLLSIAQVLERISYAHHDTRGVLWIEASAAALSVAVAAPFVYVFGIAGAAWAAPIYFGAQLLIAAGRARYVWCRQAYRRNATDAAIVVCNQN